MKANKFFCDLVMESTTRKQVFYCLFILLCVLCQPLQAVDIKKGSLDKRTYHYQVLDNNLRILLVSDPEADKAAAALDVNVGSAHDPDDRQGLAHFLEHMLFLGTKKYPEVDEYQTFISDNGGSHNAYTSKRHTNYFFDIDVNQLEPALDRFAQFFIAPLFDKNYVEQERKVVHSEFQASFREDNRRGYDVYRQVINPNHPDSKFSVGSAETLADRPNDSVREDLIDFYNMNYSPDKMTLVVSGKESIQQLQALVVNRFTQIPLRGAGEANLNKVVAEVEKSTPLFKRGQLPLETVNEPVREIRQMSMSFDVPSTRDYYREKPLNFIAHILGHEGKGSLLSLLKREGLAEMLFVSGHDKGDGRSLFYITIELTKKGVLQRELIRSLVFFVIKKIKEEGVERWRYEEGKLLSETAFHFREQADLVNTVSHLANNLHRYPPKDVIRGDYLLENYDSKLIHRFLSALTPESVYVSTVFPEAETNNKTRYYQVPYKVQSITKVQLPLDKKLTSQLTLPQKNPFVPRNIHLFAEDKTLLKPYRFMQEDNPLLSVWAKQDIRFGTPKARVMLRLTSPYVSGHLKGVVMNALYTHLLKDQLNEYSYTALLAGASFSLRPNSRGTDISFSGYHDKLHELMERLLENMDNGVISRERFDQLKSDLLRRYKNQSKKTPYDQLYGQLAANLYNLHWTYSEKITTLESVTYDELKVFVNQWRQGARVLGLFYGNVDQAWLKRWHKYVEVLQQQGDREIIAAGITALQGGVAQYSAQNIDHSDQAVALYVQGDSDSLEDQAHMALLRQIMHSPFYTSLRTEQQLGYIVFMGSLRLKEVSGSVFIVQSPSANVDKIRQAIEIFIQNFEKQLPTDITVYQQALITKLMEEPTSLAASANDYWSNLVKGNDDFNSRQRLVDAIKSTSAEQLKVYYRQVLLNPTRHLWQFSRPPLLSDADNLEPFLSGDTYYEYR